jgi:NAD(P)-dependent dehydrogenase (short-subunit alcohol dehydrogenase family)
MVFRSNTTHDFTDAVVVITGAAAGIGRQTAGLFARAGTTLALMDLADSVKEVASALGPRHAGWAVNVSDAASIAAAADEILTRFDHVDVLVNNAGTATSVSGRVGTRVPPQASDGGYCVTRFECPRRGHCRYC